jgi:prefoldin subunit 5
LDFAGMATGDIKREITQMEEEKQQLISKIARLKKRVEEVVRIAHPS